MIAWNTDANTIKLKDLDDLERHIVYNQSIRTYLKTDENDCKYFIVAPKGFGKTLLLKAKSKQYRAKSGFKCIPVNDLSERLVELDTHFSIKELNKYKRIDVWRMIWTLALHLLIVQNLMPEKLPKKLEPLLGKAKKLKDILFCILEDRNKIHKYYNLVFKELSPVFEGLTSQVAVFIDNVDEAFDKHVGDTYYDLQKAKKNHVLSPWVWINAQIGLREAVKNLCEANRHIKIFASIRSEAYALVNSSTVLQDLNYTTELNYTDEELRDIFIRNINKTATRDLVKPKAKEALVRFLGFDEIEHRFVRNEYGRKRKENVFDFILRHSFRRPREIVAIGASICYGIKANNRTATAIR